MSESLLRHGHFACRSAFRSTRAPTSARCFPIRSHRSTSDTALFLAELGWRDAWERMGAFDLDEFPPDEYCQLGVLGGYCYLNASLIRLFGERAPGLSWQMIDEQFFGAQPGIPPYEEMPGDVRPDLTEKIGETFAWVFGQQSLDDLTELTDDRVETKALRVNRPDLSALSDQQLWDRFLEMLPLHRRMFAQHIFTSYMATVPVGVITAVATAVGRPDLILPILSGIGDVDSAAPSHAMWALSRLEPTSAEFARAFDRVRRRVRQPWPERVGEHDRRRGRPGRPWRSWRSTACVRHRTPPTRPGSSRSAPSNEPQRRRSCWRWSKATRRHMVSSRRRSAARRHGCPAASAPRPTTSE